MCGWGGSTSHSGVECSPKVAIHWRGSSIEEDGSTEEGAPSEWRGEKVPIFKISSLIACFYSWGEY